jgi:hypothetical protein
MKQALLLITISVAAFGADKPLVTRNGLCAATIPGDWTVGPISSMGDSADRKVSFVISNPSRTNSLAELKNNAQMMYAEDKVTKDTATEFQMEGKGQNGKPNAYRAVISGKTICIGEVVFESGTIADARKIAETLHVK